MGKKIRIEFEYKEGFEGALEYIFAYFTSKPEISIITRMTEHDISEGSTKMVECTEIVHED